MEEEVDDYTGLGRCKHEGCKYLAIDKKGLCLKHEVKDGPLEKR